MPALKFRVILDNIEDQEIFRDVVINDDHHFTDFFETILESFDLQNDQMASFFVSDHEWNKGEEIALMDMNYDGDENCIRLMEDEIIRSYLTSPKQRFILVYDFMSMYIFLIELQEILDNKVEQPEILLSVGLLTPALKQKIASQADNMLFDTDIMDNLQEDFDGDFDGNDFGDFENIDDYEL
ncbi:MAG: hypothetical protein JJT77_01290 [Crocinitomicaceae bacterium]|nr:hypothetical protein [Crocinitomicaceae bacterium]